MAGPNRAPLKVTRRIALLLCAIASCTSCNAPAGRTIRKRHIGKLPASLVHGLVEFADDGETYAITVKDAVGQHVVVGSKNEPSHEGCTMLQFAPHSQRLFYWIGDRVDGRRQLAIVAAGQTIPANVRQPERISFSKDGGRWATAVRAEEGEGRLGHVIVLADGREVGRYADTTVPAFSADGRHLAYLAADDEGKVKLVVDGKERDPYETPETSCLPASAAANDGWTLRRLLGARYLSDGSLVTVAHDRQGWAVWRDTRRLASYPNNTPTSESGIIATLGPECMRSPSIIATSLSTPDKAAVTFWWERLRGPEERWRVVRDGTAVDSVVCGKFTDPDPPYLSADGRHYAYSCFLTERGKESHRRLVVDGRTYGPYPDACNATFSDDDAHVAYAVSDGTTGQPWSIYVDGRPVTRKYGAMWPPRFTPDGKHVAWEAKRQEHAAGGVLGVDRREIVSFDGVVWGPEFPLSGRVSWVIRRDRKLLRLDVPLP